MFSFLLSFRAAAGGPSDLLPVAGTPGREFLEKRSVSVSGTCPCSYFMVIRQAAPVVSPVFRDESDFPGQARFKVNIVRARYEMK